MAEIKAYAEMSGWSPSEFDDLNHYVRELDTIYLSFQADKRKKEANKR